MKAITLNAFGGPDAFELRDVPTPEPQAGQVLVRERFEYFEQIHKPIVSGFTDMSIR